jgi:biopolymer transport protein ExbB
MNNRFNLLAFTDNPTVWAILLVALCSYILLFWFILGMREPGWKQQMGIWLKVLPVLVGTLPLLGLLGTINGILATFRGIALDGGALDQQSLVSEGIAAALVTTQLGLVCVIPGLLLLAFLRNRYRELN